MDLCLVGKILRNKASNKEGVKRVVTNVWQVPHKIRVEQIETNNLFMFHFGSVKDRQRVLAGGPWLFEK